MSKRQERLPVEVDPFRLAEARRLLDGEIQLTQMKRLMPLLARTEGAVQLSLEFGVDTTGLATMIGTAQAKLDLLCQRCLEPMAWPLELQLALAFIRPKVDEAGIPGPYEPYVVESVPLRLSDMIEDEIILALPSIPRHELAQCPASEWLQEDKSAASETAVDKEQRQSPFSALADLNTPKKGK